jgi:hypothetical protein
MKAERAPDFVWAGRSVFRCRWCGDRFERVEDVASVIRHEQEVHEVNAAASRVSSILGPDGLPLVVSSER